jgi:hypothetical protein
VPKDHRLGLRHRKSNKQSGKSNPHACKDAKKVSPVGDRIHSNQSHHTGIFSH